MSNARWCSSRFCTGTSTISYLHLCEKTNTPFWNSADEQNLKLLTFKQSHVYSTSGFFYTTKFSQIWCVVFRNNFRKKLFSIIFDFSLFYWCSTTLILLCDLDYVCLSFMNLNVKWNLLIIANGGGVPRKKWVMHGGVPQGSVLGLYYFLFTFMWKNKHTILEFSGWTKLEDTHI